MEDLFFDLPYDFEEERQEVIDSNKIDEVKTNENFPELNIKCVLLQTPVEDIKHFVNNNPHSFLVIPTTEKGILRLSRNIKSGYKVALVASIKDLLK